MTGWQRHPGVRSGDQLTRGERAADRMRSAMGSWPFVFAFLATMAAWAALNTLLLAGKAFDRYPYILLNLFLSMMAGLQGAILLISARRQDQIASELAVHDRTILARLDTAVAADLALTEQVAGLSQAIHDHITASPPPRRRPTK